MVMITMGFFFGELDEGSIMNGSAEQVENLLASEKGKIRQFEIVYDKWPHPARR